MTGTEGAVAGSIVAVVLAAFKFAEKAIDKRNGTPPVPVVLHDTNGNKITNKDILLNQDKLVDLQRESVLELKDLNQNFVVHCDETKDLIKEIRKNNGAST